MLLRTLGGLKLQAVDFYQTKPLLLLAYLALEGSKARSHLWSLFWPEAADPANSLRVALRKLKKLLPDTLQVEDERVSAQLQTDAQALLDALEAGDFLAASMRYQDPFLDGVELRGLGLELEEWVYGTREFLARRVRGALLRLAEAEATKGRVAAAAGYAEQAYTLAGAPELEPEELGRLYMLLVGGGSPHAATLRREAGEVGITLAPATDTHGTPAQIAARATAPHNLTSRPTAFVGRDLELLEVARLLAQNECRLLTVTGPGGIGKTRLALQAAWEELKGAAFPDGVFFAPLENVASADFITVSLASALKLNQGQADALSAVAESIGNRTVLLTLDNFEHLLDGATLVSQLLGACANLKIMVTSRERLNLEEEWVVPVAGLNVPETDEDVLPQDAVQLFIKRAKRASLEFTLTGENAPHVLEICRLVGGSPLGIELAAAWVRMLSPGEIAQEIANDVDFLTSTSRDRAERHRSVRAAFEHSWKLLGPREQGVLGSLSVFQGGFRRDAASVVVGATIPVLASLVDKSLLRVAQNGRYDRHPLIFHYADEKLGESERERVQGEHARYFLALAEELHAKLQETRDFRELDVLEQEHGNLRAALRWSLAQDGTLALRLGGALGLFWETRGYLSEGRGWLEEALARYPGASAAVRARALTVLGRLTQLQGDVSTARGLLEEALRLWRLVGDVPGTADALNRLGTAVLAEQNYAHAKTYFQEGLDLYRAAGDKGGIAILLNNLGELARYQNNFEEARRFYEESLALPWGENNIRRKAIVLGNLGFVRWRSGDVDEAEALLKESLILKYEVRDEIGVSYCFAGLAGVSCEQGEFRRAALLLGVVDTLIEHTKHRLDLADRQDAERTLDRARGQLNLTVFAAAQAEGRTMALEQAVSYALGTSPEAVSRLDRADTKT